MGVGTQEKTISRSNIQVDAGATLDLTIDAFCNRGLVHSFQIEQTGGLATNVYDIHLYADGAFATLLYKIEGIIPGTPFEDFLPFWVYDAVGRQTTTGPNHQPRRRASGRVRLDHQGRAVRLKGDTNMALILFGGFEMGNFNGEFSGVEVPVIVPTVGNGSNAIIAGGRSGAFQNRLNRNTWGAFADRTSFNFPVALSEFYFQVALANNHVGKYCSADWQIIRWTKDATVLGGIWYRYAADVMEVYTGNFATLVGSFPAPPGNSVYWIFEIHLIVGASGLIEIRRDMNPVFTFSGNTKPGADTAVNVMDIGSANASIGEGTYHYVDDFVLTDPTGPAPLNSWPGGLRIACLTPNTDDGLNQWTPTPGPTHYTAVDEQPPSESGLSHGHFGGFGRKVRPDGLAGNRPSSPRG